MPRVAVSDGKRGFSDEVGCVANPDRSRERGMTPSERVRREDADYYVGTPDELESGVADADEGETVWVDGRIDWSGGGRLALDGITLASGYGIPGAESGTLFVDGQLTLLFADDGARITGLRVHGDQREYVGRTGSLSDADRWNEYVGNVRDTGIYVRGDGVEVDNVDVRGWANAGVLVKRERMEKAREPDTATYIHHAEIVDNPMESLGYGVEVRWGCPLISRCYFDNNRHSVAASGEASSGYTLTSSIVGEQHTSHALDMHGHDGDPKYDFTIGGHRTEIADNVIKFEKNDVSGKDSPAIRFRGVPIDEAVIEKNWFYRSDDAVDNKRDDVTIRQYPSGGNTFGRFDVPRDRFERIKVRDNAFGRTPNVPRSRLPSIVDGGRSAPPTPGTGSSESPSGSLLTRLFRWLRGLFG